MKLLVTVAEWRLRKLLAGVLAAIVSMLDPTVTITRTVTEPAPDRRVGPAGVEYMRRIWNTPHVGYPSPSGDR